MTTLQLIEKYMDVHAGKSSFIDKQLYLAEQLVKDTNRCVSRSDIDFALTNLYVCRDLFKRLLDAIPSPDAIRTIIIDMYSATDNHICDITEG